MLLVHVTLPSAVYCTGKATVFNRIVAQPADRSLIAVIQNSHYLWEEVTTAGVELIIVVYGGRRGENIVHLWYKVFSKLVTTSTTTPVPEKFPLTKHAAIFHMY